MAYPDLAEVKTYLVVTGTDDDVRIAQIMVWVSELIDCYLGRVMVQAEHTQTAYKVRSEYLQLRNYPVSTLTSITIDDEVQDLDDYHLIEDTGEIYGDFITGDVNVLVYTGGYTTNPAVVDEVYLSIIEDRYEDYKGLSDADVKDVTLFDFAKVSYDTANSSGARSISYSGVGSTGNVAQPLEDYLGMLDFYRSNSTLINVAGIS